MDEVVKRNSPKMFNAIADRYDFINHFISLGRHHHWRSLMMTCLPDGPDLRVLDLATGTGDVAFTLAQQEKVNFVLALDLSQRMLARAKAKQISRGAPSEKISFAYADAMATGQATSTFDAVTMSFGIRNVPDPLMCLKECHRILRAGGRVIVLESSRPSHWLLRCLNGFFVQKIVPFLGAKLSGHHTAYQYLNSTIMTFPSGASFRQLLSEAGFQNVGSKPLMLGSVELYWGDK